MRPKPKPTEGSPGFKPPAESFARIIVSLRCIPRHMLRDDQLHRIRIYFKGLGLPNVEEISMIGSSVAEIFIDSTFADTFKQHPEMKPYILENTNIMDPAPHKPHQDKLDIERHVIWRRSRIAAFGRFSVIRKAALEGVPEHIKKEISICADLRTKGLFKTYRYPRNNPNVHKYPQIGPTPNHPDNDLDPKLVEAHNAAASAYRNAQAMERDLDENDIEELRLMFPQFNFMVVVDGRIEISHCIKNKNNGMEIVDIESGTRNHQYAFAPMMHQL
jgi:hypothetical protein